MDQEKQPHIYHSAEESPIPVPPVEEGWSMMKQQLDIHQPVTGRWPVRFGKPALWMGAAAVIVTGVLVFWSVARHRAGNAPNGTVASSHRTVASSHGRVAAPRETAASSPRPGAAPTQNNPTASGNSNSTTPINSGKDPNPANTGAPSAPGYTNPNRTRQNQATPTYRLEADRTRSNHSTHAVGHDLISQNASRTTNRHLASNNANHDPTNNTTSRDRTRTPGPTRRWTTSKTKLARTNPPAPKFIPAADSLLKAIHSGSKTAASPPKSRNKQTGLALAAGISLGQSIPIGQQQLSSYNLLSDYIPSPYLRLYIGDRWYLQTTPHLLSAQYTPSQLIDSSGGDTSRIPGYPQYLQYSKVTLKKLYYTDIPLTINYRVFKGFYLGAGIQYSRLWQAAGEDRITLRPSNGLGNDTLYSSKIVGLKNNDSVFRKLARSDWRLLLEADYVWRRFTFGLQYQRGLNTYLPVTPSGSKGTDKNSSFSIHVYYEIWNQRRKNN